jgi:hypothetical protein
MATNTRKGRWVMNWNVQYICLGLDWITVTTLVYMDAENYENLGIFLIPAPNRTGRLRNWLRKVLSKRPDYKASRHVARATCLSEFRRSTDWPNISCRRGELGMRCIALRGSQCDLPRPVSLLLLYTAQSGRRFIALYSEVKRRR